MTDSARAGLADDETAIFRNAIEGPLSEACDRGIGLVINMGIGHSSCLLAQRPSLGVMLNP
jgi:hypothetical protein